VAGEDAAGAERTPGSGKGNLHGAPEAIEPARGQRTPEVYVIPGGLSGIG
jgi:hypothetical protein